MSDRSYFQLKIYDVPDDERAALMEIIEDEGLSRESEVEDDSPHEARVREARALIAREEAGI
jgi:hypothetical protein